MVKSGLITGGAALLLALLVSLLSPICASCVAILAGLAAGYLAGVYDRPIDSDRSVRLGAGAGAIAGGLAVIGQLIAAAVNASAMQAPGGQVVPELFGLPPAEPGVVWASQLIVGCCIGLVNVALMAGTGAAGGALWFRRGRPTPPQEPIPPAL